MGKIKRGRQSLQSKIEEIKRRRDEQKYLLFNTSDDTRASLTTFQNTLYFTQIAIGVFKNLTNYHVPPRKRWQNALVTISSVLLTEVLRRKFSKQEETPTDAQ